MVESEKKKYLQIYSHIRCHAITGNINIVIVLAAETPAWGQGYWGQRDAWTEIMVLEFKAQSWNKQGKWVKETGFISIFMIKEKKLKTSL